MVAPATTPSTPTPMTIIEELLQPGAEVVVLARAGERGQLGQERGLDRLEQQDRDAGDEETRR